MRGGEGLVHAVILALALSDHSGSMEHPNPSHAQARRDAGWPATTEQERIIIRIVQRVSCISHREARSNVLASDDGGISKSEAGASDDPMQAPR